MIFQCYFRTEQRARLFPREPYVGFGLEPEVNPNIADGAPELADPHVRTALVEYGAMLHIWRNQSFNGSDWIGFTSYRQLDKTDWVFDSRAQVEELLSGYDYLAWHTLFVRHLRTRARRHIPLLGQVSTVRLRGAAAQSELYHPLLHSFTVDMLKAFGCALPQAYHRDIYVAYGNYWVMRVAHFNAFMEWSWPILRHALAVEHAFKTYAHSWNPHDDKRKAVGYLMERLFIIWTMSNELRGRRLLGPQSILDPHHTDLGGKPAPRRRKFALK